MFKKYKLVILFNIVFFILLLFIVEGAFRLLKIGYLTQPVNGDSILHHVHPSNMEFLIHDPNKEYGGHLVKYNEFGNRVDLTPSGSQNSETVLFLGDSFTESIQVEWDSTFVGRFSNDFDEKYNVINMGTSSYSPLLYLIQLDKYLESNPKPKTIFIQLYGNDVRGDDMYKELTEYDSIGFPLTCDGGKNSSFYNLFRSSYLLRMVKKTQYSIEYMLDKESRVNEINIPNYIEESPQIENTEFAKNILLIDSFLDSKSIDYYFFSIPSKYSCFYGDWDRKTFSKEFKDFSVDHNLNVIDIDSFFQSSTEQTKLFYKNDIHCTETGNRLIFNALQNASSK